MIERHNLKNSKLYHYIIISLYHHIIISSYHCIRIMGKKRTRYSSSLAADWVISPPRTEKVAAVETSADNYPPHESHRPTNSYQGLVTTEIPSVADDARRRARYKKSLPSNWIASGSEDGPIAESPKLLRAMPGSAPTDFELHDAGIWPTPGRPHFTNRYATPSSIVSTSLPTRKHGEFVPPPAPTKPVREQHEQSIFHDNSSPINRSRAGQRSSAGIEHSQPFQDTTVSPPISTTQSSTDSPSYGRDIPAIAPTISPNYSTC